MEYEKATGILRELQLCELEMMKDFKAVCEKYNLTYYLSSGTLLGAVRHGGFIPWDDDVDIEMPYADYLRFLEIAQRELSEKDYFVQTSDTDEHYNRMYARIRKNNTTMMTVYQTRNMGHHGVWVDIFPHTYVSGNLDLFLKKTAVRINNFLLVEERTEAEKRWIRSRSNALSFGLVSLLMKLPKKLKKRLSRLLTKFVFRKKACKRKSDKIIHVWTNITRVNKQSVFKAEHKMLLFENDFFQVPHGYEEYLRGAYGDYMTPPPENKRSGGHGDINSGELIVDLKNDYSNYIKT